MSARAALRGTASARRPEDGPLGSDPRPDPTDPRTADPHTGEQPDGAPVENPSG
ncbi:hypothetical protein [Amnibacterium kyonggiense]|uniref:hypothetical protein n=1 Tax=Amnibacterium kyonggiense TaxID=595671 RepID=UPI0013C2D680|nr:hypothetical protein [Amnibacterium kyonggiense]